MAEMGGEGCMGGNMVGNQTKPQVKKPSNVADSKKKWMRRIWVYHRKETYVWFLSIISISYDYYCLLKFDNVFLSENYST